MDEFGIAIIIIIGLIAVAALPFISFIILLCLMAKLSRLEKDFSSRFSNVEKMLWSLRGADAKKAGPEEEKAPEPKPCAMPAAPPVAAQAPASKAGPVSEAPKPAEAVLGVEAVKERPLAASGPAQEPEPPLKAAAPLPLEMSGPKREAGEKQQKIWTPEPPLKMAAPPARQASEFERNAMEMLRKIWNWILYGEETRPKDVSLEYTLASVWLPRIGVIILLAGIVFGISYSIANNYIGPTGRVTLSFLAGFGLVGWGLRLANKKYHVIAQALLGGGMATLYFSAFASAMMYHLIPSSLAFALMILITAGSCAVSMKIDSLLMAVIGTVGGYLTPVMLSTGEKNLPGLFSYMAMLGCGLVWVARRKDWKLLNILSFLFSYGIYFAALDKFYEKPADYPVAMGFLTLFFLLFSFIPVLYNIVHGAKATALELLFMTLNATLYFCGAYGLTAAIYGKEWTAAVSVSLALFYLAKAYWLLRGGSKDKGLLVMLSAFAAFFIAFTMPLVLSGQWVTTAWSIQALLFMWMSRKLGGNFIKTLAYAIYAVAAFRLMFIDFPHNFGGGFSMKEYWDNIISRVCTFGVFIASAAGAWKLIKDARKEAGAPGELRVDPAADTKELVKAPGAGAAFLCVAFGLLFVYLHFELGRFCLAIYPGMLPPVLTGIWVVAAVLAAAKFAESRSAALVALALAFGAGAVAKLLLFDVHDWTFSLSSMCYRCPDLWGPMAMRAFDFIPVVAALCFGAVAARGSSQRAAASAFGTLALLTLFVYLTLETKTLLGFVLPGFKDGAVSALWGIFALSLLIAGMRKDFRAMRYAGLAIFIVTAFKIFLFDLASLSQLARVAAFIALGFTTLAGAFAYVKFKGMFTNDAKKEEPSK